MSTRLQNLGTKLKLWAKAAWKFVVIVWECKLWGFHDWTCAATEHIPPTAKQLTSGVSGFWDYAKTYCRRCGVENRSSVEARALSEIDGIVRDRIKEQDRG
jgi:hypothetical protein